MFMLISLLLFLFLQVQANVTPNDKPNIPVVHPKVGQTLVTGDLQVTFVGRKSYYTGAPAESLDADIDSPKSVNVHHTLGKYYVNSLEGCKPVESVLSHGGRYLWVPYYRRTYDLNAQEPSTMAVIDTQADTIVRLFETGPLPKMVAVSDDQTRLAVTHWCNNTVGILDVASTEL